ncbi:MAG: hypothetical protein RR750_21830 [Citrobacter sp.]
MLQRLGQKYGVLLDAVIPERLRRGMQTNGDTDAQAMEFFRHESKQGR